MKKPMKGTFGYINAKKKSQLLLSILLFSFVIIVFITGVIINDESRSSTFTVMAMLLVLPAAMMFVNYLILLPYHSVSKNKLDEVVSRLKEGSILYTDIVMTSPKKIMNLAFLVILDQYVVGFVGREKEDRNYISNYLSSNIKSRALPYKIKIFNDETKFLKELSSNQQNVENDTNIESITSENELKSYLLSLMV